MKKVFLSLLVLFVFSFHAKSQNALISRFSLYNSSGYVTNGSNLPYLWYLVNETTLGDTVRLKTSAYQNFVSFKNVTTNMYVTIDTLKGNIYLGDILTVDFKSVSGTDTLFLKGFFSGAASDSIITAPPKAKQFIFDGTKFVHIN